MRIFVFDFPIDLATDDANYWGDYIVTSVPNSTTFTFNKSGPNISSHATAGIVALQFSAILDNATSSRLVGIESSYTSNHGFNDFFDIWDDENCTIDHFSNNGTGTQNTANWVHSIVYANGQDFVHAPLIHFLNSTVTNTDAGVTVTNSNGVYVSNTVIQGYSLYQLHISNETGNYQGAYIQNLYPEASAASANSGTPWAGTGVAGLVYGASTGASRMVVTGIGNPAGAIQSSGSGSTTYEYYVVAHDGSGQTWPLYVQEVVNNQSGSPLIKWPRIANGADTITYDVIRTTGGPVNSQSYLPPAYNACAGTSITACGSVALGLAQCSGLVCSYTDNSAASTSSYTVFSYSRFYPTALLFWPGSFVTTNIPIYTDSDALLLVNVGMEPMQPTLIAKNCMNFGANSGVYAWSSCPSPWIINNSMPFSQGWLIGDSGDQQSTIGVRKGRLNFLGQPVGSPGAHHIITLQDSTPFVTMGSWGYRPLANAADAWIGTDQTSGSFSSTKLALGAFSSISSYINDTGSSGTTWKEQLTASQKTFSVPIATPSATIVLLTSSISANTCNVQTAALSGLAATSVVKWSWASTPIGVAGYGTGGLQISAFATANTANVVICNITGLAITPGTMSLNLRAEL